MKPEEVEVVLHKIFVECNGGGDSSQLDLHKDSFIRLFGILNDLTKETISYLTHSDRDQELRDAVAEVSIVFLLNGVKGGEPTEWDKTVLSAEVCVAESLHRTMTTVGLEFGTGDLWLALIHYEADERTEPFTTDYLSADDSIRQKYIVHACLDAALPGREVPDATVSFVVEHIGMLPEICVLVHQRQSFSIGMVQEFLANSAKSLSLGVL
jgi:hypothetical protein